MHKDKQSCIGLIVKTANALDGKQVALMLLAVQERNLESSIRYAIRRYVQ